MRGSHAVNLRIISKVCQHGTERHTTLQCRMTIPLERMRSSLAEYCFTLWALTLQNVGHDERHDRLRSFKRPGDVQRTNLARIDQVTYCLNCNARKLLLGHGRYYNKLNADWTYDIPRLRVSTSLDFGTRDRIETTVRLQ